MEIQAGQKEKRLFEAAAGQETLGGGLTFLRLVPADFATTLERIRQAHDAQPAFVTVVPDQAHDRILSYWINQWGLRATDRTDFILNDITALVRMNAGAEHATSVQVVFHNVTDPARPFLPHAGLRLIYDISPNEQGWAIAQISPGMRARLGPQAMFVDIIAMQTIADAAENETQRHHVFLEKLEAYKAELRTKTVGMSELASDLLAKMVEINPFILNKDYEPPYQTGGAEVESHPLPPPHEGETTRGTHLPTREERLQEKLEAPLGDAMFDPRQAAEALAVSGLEVAARNESTPRSDLTTHELHELHVEERHEGLESRAGAGLGTAEALERRHEAGRYESLTQEGREPYATDYKGMGLPTPLGMLPEEKQQHIMHQVHLLYDEDKKEEASAMGTLEIARQGYGSEPHAARESDLHTGIAADLMNEHLEEGAREGAPRAEAEPAGPREAAEAREQTGPREESARQEQPEQREEPAARREEAGQREEPRQQEQPEQRQESQQQEQRQESQRQEQPEQREEPQQQEQRQESRQEEQPGQREEPQQQEQPQQREESGRQESQRQEQPEQREEPRQQEQPEQQESPQQQSERQGTEQREEATRRESEEAPQRNAEENQRQEQAAREQVKPETAEDLKGKVDEAKEKMGAPGDKMQEEARRAAEEKDRRDEPERPEQRAANEQAAAAEETRAAAPPPDDRPSWDDNWARQNQYDPGAFRTAEADYNSAASQQETNQQQTDAARQAADSADAKAQKHTFSPLFEMFSNFHFPTPEGPE
ncbi:MAG: hypothetical protein P4M15_03995 [Alphaproteobacteria bacterium]|nr:hypothetical protein [Alphaproteobacteria bacterium]